jgi:ABC-type phosphate transport system auxiliary subunit
MTFQSHPIVKEYMEELKKITDLREEVRKQLADTWDRCLKTEDDEERSALTIAAKNLEQQVNSLTAKGNNYMLKVDQLNGVR